jgi:TrmH family RNA methyltransferase
MPEVRRITSESDEFQTLAALLTNRSKRHRRGEFLVQGVRPVTRAVDVGWPIEAVLVDADRRRASDWARGVVARAGSPVVIELDRELFAQLAEKDEPGEVLLVARQQQRSLTDVAAHVASCVVVCDRVASPGNLGTMVRSADAFGADAVVVTGHAADPFDPAAVRASTGSVFSVPIVQVAGMGSVADWLVVARGSDVPVRVVGADELGTPMSACDLTGPLVLVVGAEGSGLSRAAVDLCDELVAIPMKGSASSLNVATAASILLYEIARTR